MVDKDLKLMVRKSCDLRQVGDAQGLAMLGQAFQQGAHGIGGIAADAGVHLVKYLGRGRRTGLGGNLDRKTDAG